MTEEGLAVVNQSIEKAFETRKSKLFFKAALNYYAAFMASKLSFVDLFKDLAAFQEDEVKRWRMCVRVKRGMIDTG